jgi:hypothetical protein
MAKSPRLPSYRLHKGSGQAFVQVQGRRHYLGKHGAAESHERYDRAIAEILTHPARMCNEPRGVESPWTGGPNAIAKPRGGDRPQSHRSRESPNRSPPSTSIASTNTFCRPCGASAALGDPVTRGSPPLAIDQAPLAGLPAPWSYAEGAGRSVSAAGPAERVPPESPKARREEGCRVRGSGFGIRRFRQDTGCARAGSATSGLSRTADSPSVVAGRGCVFDRLLEGGSSPLHASKRRSMASRAALPGSTWDQQMNRWPAPVLNRRAGCRAHEA